MKYIITVPHGACISKTIRTCDTNAVNAAQALKRSLQNKGKEVILLTHTDPNLPRSIVDLNRSEGRWTELRQELFKIIEEDKNIMILDVHSFPPGSFDTDKEIVMLDNIPGVNYWKKYCKKIEDICEYIPGSSYNDIVYTSRLLGIQKSILFEFREDLDEKRLQDIANIMVDKLILD